MPDVRDPGPDGAIDLTANGYLSPCQDRQAAEGAVAAARQWGTAPATPATAADHVRIAAPAGRN